jgi:aminoglycoside 3-N-acetyltransferase
MPTEKELLAPAVAGRHPVTRSRLAHDLRKLGLAEGAIVIVHTAMSRLGWIVGGSQTVIDALRDVLGESGTLVMPAHSSQLTEPSRWQAPPVPESWWDVIREQLPAYDPDLTPTRNMGVVAETFRRLPGVLRSGHPHVSFAALGPKAQAVLQDHPIGCMFGERSPLAVLYELDAAVLLLGVDHGNDTAIHLAEYRSEFPGKAFHEEGAPMMVDGRRQWVRFEDLAVRDDDFAQLGETFARDTAAERRGPVGWGEGRLAPMRAVVDYAEQWLATYR